MLQNRHTACIFFSGLMWTPSIARMGTISDQIHFLPSSIGFSVFSAEEVRKLSKVEITSTVSVNDLGQPIPGGVYDLKMGTFYELQKGNACILTRFLLLLNTCHTYILHFAFCIQYILPPKMHFFTTISIIFISCFISKLQYVVIYCFLFSHVSWMYIIKLNVIAE